MFSPSGKVDFQIPCFPCDVGTLPFYGKGLTDGHLAPVIFYGNRITYSGVILPLVVLLPPANKFWDNVIFSEACVNHSVRGQGSHFSGLTKFPDFSSIFSIFPVVFYCFVFFN